MTYSDDERRQCVNCNKEIRWCALNRKWYHVVNFGNYCAGKQKFPNGKDSTQAEPKDEDNGKSIKMLGL